MKTPVLVGVSAVKTPVLVGITAVKTPVLVGVTAVKTPVLVGVTAVQVHWLPLNSTTVLVGPQCYPVCPQSYQIGTPTDGM